MSVEDFIKLHWLADLALRLNGERVLCFDDGGGGGGGGGDGDGGDGDDGDDGDDGEDEGETDEAETEADIEDPEANFDFTSPDITGFDTATAAGQAGVDAMAEASPADIAAALEQQDTAQQDLQDQAQQDIQALNEMQGKEDPNKEDKEAAKEDPNKETTTVGVQQDQALNELNAQALAEIMAAQQQQDQTQQDLAQNFASFTSFEPPAPASPSAPTGQVMSDVNAFGVNPGAQFAAAPNTIMDLVNPMGVQVQDVPPGAPLSPSSAPQQGPIEMPGPAPGQSPSAAPAGPYETPSTVEKEFQEQFGQTAAPTAGVPDPGLGTPISETPAGPSALGSSPFDETGFEAAFGQTGQTGQTGLAQVENPGAMQFDERGMYGAPISNVDAKSDLAMSTVGMTGPQGTNVTYAGVPTDQTPQGYIDQNFPGQPQSQQQGSYVFDQPPEQVPAAAPPTFQDIWTDRVDIPNTTLSPGQFNQIDQQQVDREARGAVPTTVEPGPAPGVLPGQANPANALFDTVAPTTTVQTTSPTSQVSPTGAPPAPPPAPQSMNPGQGRFSDNPSQNPRDYFGPPPGQTPTPPPQDQPSAPPPFDQPGPTNVGGFDPGVTDGGGGDFLNPSRGPKSFDATSPTTPGAVQIAQALTPPPGPGAPTWPTPPGPQPQSIPDTSFQRRPVGDQGDAGLPDQVRLARIRAALAQALMQQQDITRRGTG